MRGSASVLAIALALVHAQAALAFGVLNHFGQHAEHGRITRQALACRGSASGACFEPRAMAALAGEPGRPGAIAAPDMSLLAFRSAAHCDNGDVLDRPGYPQSAAAARGKLKACRDWMQTHMDSAVGASAALLDAAGRPSTDESIESCFGGRYPRNGGRCRVIAELGLVLHASQDFYAHTNWVDRPDPRRRLGLDNPPGLGQDGPAPFISLRQTIDPPAGLISGCFVAPPEQLFCHGRVRHAALNKDEGQIGPPPLAGTTARGRVQDNFARAVRAAVADTADKWALFRTRLAQRYGAARAQRMICVIVSDAPARRCR